MITDIETGVKFEDYTENAINDFDTTYWTQVCDQCAKKYGLLDSYLSIGDGSGICGVVGCNSDSDHYYDFNAKQSGENY